jgi:hypothetical protein
MTSWHNSLLIETIDYNKYVYFYVVVLNTLGFLGYTLRYFRLP